MASIDTSSITSSYTPTTTTSATTSTTDTAKSTLVGSYDTFLKILTTQLQNQDPTEPVDASEFTNQLVMYSQVEQQISTNDKLDDLLSAMGIDGVKPLLSYMNQYAEVKASDELVVQGGEAMLSYDLPSDAQSVTVYVQDSSGNVIATVSGPTDEGMHRISWDATLDSGSTAADGVYNFVISAKDSSGDSITLDDVRIIGKVTSIETGDEGAVSMTMGDLTLSDDDILSVFGSAVSSSSVETASSKGTSTSSTEEDS